MGVYIITVSPLGVTSPAHRDGSLTYFSKSVFSAGDIVHITIGRMRTLGVVRVCSPLAKNKLLLKSHAYALKCLGNVYATRTGLSSFFSIADALASAFFTQSGAILKLLVPSILLDHPKDAFPLPELPWGSGHTKSLVIGSEPDRIAHYKTLAHNNGTLVIIAPTIGALTKLTSLMPDATTLSPKMGIRAFRTIRHSTLDTPHSRTPSILLTTPAFLAFLPKDTHTIVLDDAFSPHLSREESPRIHLRAVVDAYAKQQKLSLVLGSPHWVPDAIAYEKNAHLLTPEHPIAIVNMHPEQLGRSEYALLSRYAREHIAKGGRALVIVNRKGYAPLAICKDCGLTLLCKNCEAPLTAHGTEILPDFRCHHCGDIPAPVVHCRTCPSTTFALYGVGVSRMAELLASTFPKRPIITLDGDMREKAQTQVCEEFIKNENAILVSTEVVFEHTLPHIAVGLAASIDHLFSLPEYRTEESIARLVLRLGDTTDTTIIQTRMPEKVFWKELDTTHRAHALATRLLTDRSRAKLPPAVILVQCTVQKRILAEAESAAQQLGRACVRLRVPAHVHPAFIPRERNYYIWHVLIRLPLKTWNDTEHPVRGLLAQLGHEWSVAVNPRNTL